MKGVICVLFTLCAVSVNSLNIQSPFLKDLDQTLPSTPIEATNSITINIRIHVDSKLLETLKTKYEWKNETLHKLTQILLKETSALFNDPILKVKVNFNLRESRFVIAKPFFYDGPLEKYYEAYCSWQGGLKRKRQEDCYSVLLTSRKVDVANGYASRNSLCHKLHSCSVIQWVPEKLEYFLAKSIGLNLGMVPASEGKGCSPVGIMDNVLTKTRGHVWTKCNDEEMRNFLQTDEAKCLKGGHHSLMTGLTGAASDETDDTDILQRVNIALK